MKTFMKLSLYGLPSFLPVLAIAGGSLPHEPVNLHSLPPTSFSSNLAFGLVMLGILASLGFAVALVYFRHRPIHKALELSNEQARQTYARLGLMLALVVGVATVVAPPAAYAQAQPAARVQARLTPAEEAQLQKLLPKLSATYGIAAVPTTANPVKVEVTNPAPAIVAIPTGDLYDMLFKFVFAILGLVLTMALAYVPFPLRGIVKSLLVDKMLAEADAFAHNAVPNAKKGDVVNIDVGNQVLAVGLKHALTWPKMVVDWAGGEERIAQQLFAKLNLPSNADVTQFDVKAP